MSKYTKRQFVCGEWWLQKRGSAYYGIRYVAQKRSNERRSLGTSDLEEAKQELTKLYLQTRIVLDEKPTEALLADILRRYYEEHAKDLRSAGSTRDWIKRWLDYWDEATVADLRNIARQEDFHKHLRQRGHKPSSMMRVINTGKAALNRAFKRHELESVPHILTVAVGKTAPKGRPLDVPDLQSIYEHAAPHVRQFIIWALGTAARPEAVLELNSKQVDWENGLVDLLPEGREQLARKYRPVVKLPDALQMCFEGFAVSYKGEPVKSIKKALWRACDRAGVPRCSSYSFRHTAARWMRKQGVGPWEVSAQLGHSAGKRFAVTERYAAHSPEYLANAVKTLSELVEIVRCGPVAGQRRTDVAVEALKKLVPQEGFEPPTPSLRIMDAVISCDD